MVEHDFRSLSPADFRRLTCDVLNADLGLWLRDLDGRGLCQVGPDGSTLVVRCAHEVDATRPQFLRVVREEARRRAARPADRQLFVTSHPMSPRLAEDVARAIGIARDDVWGPGEVSEALARHPRVERRHIKLWLGSVTALEGVLTAGRWRRTGEELRAFADHARYWVDTPARAEVTDALEREGVCLIGGPIGGGKSFLAEILTLEAARDGWEVVYLGENIADAWKVRRQGVRQFFFYDDFLGQDALAQVAFDTAPGVVRFVDDVRKHRDTKRLLLTSRDTVLAEAARARDDRLRDIAAKLTPYTVGPATLGAATRREILRNHVHFSGLSAGERDRFGSGGGVRMIVEHGGFNPRAIETILRRPLRDSVAGAVAADILRAFEDSAAAWEAGYAALPPLRREVVLTLATCPPRPIPQTELRALLSVPTGTKEWRTALGGLEREWIRAAGQDADRVVSFANPGYRDYLLGVIDSPGVAADRVARIRSLGQLLTLSETAGLSGHGPMAARPLAPAGSPGADPGPGGVRAHLACALTEWGARLAERVRGWVLGYAADGLADRMAVMRRAASALTLFGVPTGTGWYFDRVDALLADERTGAAITADDGFSLAARLDAVPCESLDLRDGLVRRLVIMSLANAYWVRDLDAYEALPEHLRGPAVRHAAGRRAAQIIDVELSLLAQDRGNPGLIRESAFDLRARSHLYGHAVEIDGILTRAAELAVYQDRET